MIRASHNHKGAHQAPCILQLLQPHVLLPHCQHCWVQLPAMHLAIRVEVVHQVGYRTGTLRTPAVQDILTPVRFITQHHSLIDEQSPKPWILLDILA